MNIKELVNQSHGMASKNGFWEDYANIAEALSQDNDINFIKQCTNNAIGNRLMLIVSEIAEAQEALRAGNTPFYELKLSIDDYAELNEVLLGNPDFEYLHKIIKKAKYVDSKENFKEELADAAIRIGDLAGGLNIDLQSEIIKKMDKNRLRPFRHNKEF